MDPQAKPREDVLDIAYLERNFLSSPELLAETSQMFFKELGGHLERIRGTIDDGDSGALERAAHTLKGAIFSLGGLSAGTAAGRLEELGRQKDLSSLLSDAYSRLVAETSIFVDELNRFVKQLEAA